MLSEKSIKQYKTLALEAIKNAFEANGYNEGRTAIINSDLSLRIIEFYNGVYCFRIMELEDKVLWSSFVPTTHSPDGRRIIAEHEKHYTACRKILNKATDANPVLDVNSTLTDPAHYGLDI